MQLITCQAQCFSGECSRDVQTKGKKRVWWPCSKSRAKEEMSPRSTDPCHFLHSWHPELAPATLVLGPEAVRHKCAPKQDLESCPSCTQDLTPTQPNSSYYWLLWIPAVSGRSPWPGGPFLTSWPFLWLSSQRRSQIITSCCRSRSVMERWNIRFQITERLSAVFFFFFSEYPCQIIHS